jgi:hypothetical protein
MPIFVIAFTIQKYACVPVTDAWIKKTWAIFTKVALFSYRKE